MINTCTIGSVWVRMDLVKERERGKGSWKERRKKSETERVKQKDEICRERHRERGDSIS